MTKVLTISYSMIRAMLTRKIIERIEPFVLSDLLHYNPKFLAGFEAERYKTGLKAVWERAKQRISLILRSDITAIIKRGCDVVDSLNVNTKFSEIKYKHMLLPVWISSYKYRDKVYNFFINGQTGEVQGSAPKSVLKILGVIAVVIAVLVGSILYIKNQMSIFSILIKTVI